MTTSVVRTVTGWAAAGLRIAALGVGFLVGILATVALLYVAVAHDFLDRILSARRRRR